MKTRMLAAAGSAIGMLVVQTGWSDFYGMTQKTIKMKKRRLVSTALLAIFAASSVAYGSVIVTSSSTAPSVAGTDVAFLPGIPIAENTNVGSFAPWEQQNRITEYDIRTPKGYNAPGQTFTTGSNTGGYSIGSITVQHVLYSPGSTGGTWSAWEENAPFRLVFGELVGGTTKSQMFATSSATYTGESKGANVDLGTGRYFTFNLSSEVIANLNPNTQYYFEIQNAAVSGDKPYLELMGVNTDSYAGGTAYYEYSSGGYTALSGDRAFHVGLTAIPEPASLGMLGAAAAAMLLRRRFAKK